MRKMCREKVTAMIYAALPQGPQLSDGESNPLSLAWPVAQYALTTRLWGQRIIVIISDNEHSSLY